MCTPKARPYNSNGDLAQRPCIWKVKNCILLVRLSYDSRQKVDQLQIKSPMAKIMPNKFKNLVHTPGITNWKNKFHPIRSKSYAFCSLWWWFFKYPEPWACRAGHCLNFRLGGYKAMQIKLFVITNVYETMESGNPSFWGSICYHLFLFHFQSVIGNMGEKLTLWADLRQSRHRTFYWDRRSMRWLWP